MLDFAYVYSLENRYKKYKKRQYIRITMYILFLFVLCITIATLLFLQKEEKSVLITNKNIQDNATTANDDTIKNTCTITNNLESNLILSVETRKSTILTSTVN